MNELAAGSRVHLIAICGVGMASLAGLLQSRGYRVTGSDQNVYPPMSTYLDELGIKVFSGYAASHIEDRPDLVVIGNAISKDNPEAKFVLEREIPYLSLPQALSRFLIADKRSIVIAGTHGKTTTASLMAWVLTQAEMDPSFFIGGIPLNFQSGFRSGQGPWVAMEGDEYDSAFFDKGPKFLHYQPENVILTSIEFDHADIYRDLEHLKAAFRRLAEIISPGGNLLACSEYPAAVEVSRAANCRVIFYGEEEESGWKAGNIRPRGRRTTFEVCYGGRSEGVVDLPLMGKHNVNNALAVYALGREIGLPHGTIGEGLATFAGVRRRQEWKGDAGGVTLIDDFAHHPTAVKETVAAVRAGYGDRRLWAIFEPRSHTSRRNIFETEFAEALAGADRVVVAGLYQPEKIPTENRLSPANVVGTINRATGDRRATLVEIPGHIPDYVAREARAGDVILVMSNGGFDAVQEKILRLLGDQRRGEQ
jgi:UDP-N-acetylmuramate: L-alanyl-gamma-D-glutamyl-meso-diaminopimelate ligase